MEKEKLVNYIKFDVINNCIDFLTDAIDNKINSKIIVFQNDKNFSDYEDFINKCNHLFIYNSIDESEIYNNSINIVDESNIFYSVSMSNYLGKDIPFDILKTINSIRNKVVNFFNAEIIFSYCLIKNYNFYTNIENIEKYDKNDVLICNLIFKIK